MLKVVRLGSPVALVIALAAIASAQTDDLAEKLKTLPHVKEVRQTPGGASYDISFEQPVDHTKPQGQKFLQHLFLAPTAYDQPVILGTEGYSANRPGGGELRRMLGTPNLLTVEHRYFGHSIPAPLDWKYLTIKNAADDMHEIVTAFKKLYKGKWIATGASKGGQTALFFKCYYPDDVDATVSYVAPINIGQEDPRINYFMETVGDQATRDKIKAFQIALLKHEDEIIPLLNVDPKNYSMGVAKAYEYGVLEFPYGFWQYGTKPETLPNPDASTAELAAEYKKVNTMYYYSDPGIHQFEAFMYQAFTEIGYYNYDIADFKPYLKANPNPTNMDLCPAGTKDKIVYNPETLAFVFHYLQYNAQNVVFIYGETDAWSATQMQLIGRTNAIKIVVKGAWHNANVRAASLEQQDLFYSTMEKWLGMNLFRT